MRNLSDYSGEFLPDFRMNDFSHDVLADLLKLYSKLYGALDGFWYLTVKDRIGNKEALDSDLQAWEKICQYEMKYITRQLNIQGNDVISLMKAIQVIPWFQQMQYKIEIEGPNIAMLEINYCPTLEALEKEGTGRENQICKIVEPFVLKNYASFFNPDIEVECLKLPPRKSKSETCCQWRIIGGK